MKILNYFKTIFGIKSKGQKTCCNDGICQCKKTEESPKVEVILELPKQEFTQEIHQEENVLQETPKKKKPYRKYNNKKKESPKEKVEEVKKESTSKKPKKKYYNKRKPKSDNNTQNSQN